MSRPIAVEVPTQLTAPEHAWSVAAAIQASAGTPGHVACDATRQTGSSVAGSSTPARRSPVTFTEWQWLPDYPLATWDPYALHPDVLAPAQPVIGHPLVVLVDDARTFRDGRKHEHAQTSAEAILIVSSLVNRHIDELWLDYDLLDGDTIGGFVEYLVRRADSNAHVNVGHIIVHTARVDMAPWIMATLGQKGRYRVSRSYAAGMWRRLSSQASARA